MDKRVINNKNNNYRRRILQKILNAINNNNPQGIDIQNLRDYNVNETTINNYLIYAEFNSTPLVEDCEEEDKLTLSELKKIMWKTQRI